MVSQFTPTQIPCAFSPTRISRSIAVAPRPPLQRSSDSETAGCRVGTARLRRHVGVESHLKSNLSLVSPDDHWSNLTLLFSAGAFGIWSEKTKMGSALSGPLVSTLLGLAASRFGIIASDASTFPIVLEVLLPPAYTLLLFRSDLRRVIKPTWTLLSVFVLGSAVGGLDYSTHLVELKALGSFGSHSRTSCRVILTSFVVVFFLWIVGTTIGSLVAFICTPMSSFGELIWRFGALAIGMHFVGVSKHNSISDNFDEFWWVTGLVVDNVTRAVYFAVLFALASKIPPETTPIYDDDGKDTETEYNNKLPMSPFATSLVVSLAICKVGSYLTQYFRIQGGTMQAITVVTVILATIFPKPFAYLATSGEAMATILIQVFFVVLGAKGNMDNTAPHIIIFSLIQTSVHFAIIFGLGKLLRFDLKSLLIASIGNFGGPMAVYVMAAAKGWGSMVIPGILAGILRIPIARLLALGLSWAISKT